MTNQAAPPPTMLVQVTDDPADEGIYLAGFVGAMPRWLLALARRYFRRANRRAARGLNLDDLLRGD